MREKIERDFKGVWIPKEIWLDEELTALDKAILVEINSLDVNEEGCYASNKYLSEFCQCTETKISTAIKKLIELGYVEVINFDGRKRYLKSDFKKFKGRLKKNERQTLKNLKADFKKVKDININNNINNNIINNSILNEFKIYNVFDKNYQCECISKTTNEQCQRRAIYNINGKNYCNQHSRGLIPDLKIKSKVFKKPTIEEIQEYCIERNNNINAIAFYDFYESKDWMVGKNKMKDWKACVRTWEQRNKVIRIENKKDIPKWFYEDIQVQKYDDEEVKNIINKYK